MQADGLDALESSPAAAAQADAIGQSMGAVTRGGGAREGWILMAPAVVILLLLTIFPAIYLLYSSFFSLGLLPPTKEFVGLGNYIQIIQDPTIRFDLLKTLLFVVLAVGLEMLIGMLLAIPLAPRSRANQLAATFLLLPFAVTPAVSALIWKQLLNPNYGWVDYYLQQAHLMSRPVEWLSNPVTAWVAIVAIDVWQWTPFVALILMAGLQGIPAEPKEAAMVEGASAWQLYWYVTLPLLKPFVAIAFILRLIDAFKTFATVQVMTGGGPGRATEIINLSIYRVALENFQSGAAAALGIFFLILLSLIVPRLLSTIAGSQDLMERV